MEELIQRVSLLEDKLQDNAKPVKKKREKRPPSEKQKEQHARFKEAYNKWAPEFKKENPSLKSHEVFKMVHAKLKEEKK